MTKKQMMINYGKLAYAIIKQAIIDSNSPVAEKGNRQYRNQKKQLKRDADYFLASESAWKNNLIYLIEMCDSKKQIKLPNIVL